MTNSSSSFSALEQHTLAQFKQLCCSKTLQVIEGKGDHNWFRCGTLVGFVASKFDVHKEIMVSLLPGREPGTTIWCLHNAGEPKNVLHTL